MFIVDSNISQLL